jgi:hypothetical protein
VTLAAGTALLIAVAELLLVVIGALHDSTVAGPLYGEDVESGDE